jgi:hypothetical protein
VGRGVHHDRVAVDEGQQTAARFGHTADGGALPARDAGEVTGAVVDQPQPAGVVEGRRAGGELRGQGDRWFQGRQGVRVGRDEQAALGVDRVYGTGVGERGQAGPRVRDRGLR